MRKPIPLFLIAALLSPTAALANSSTTRIETRPFYGATVTLEEGVRVFRPLPSHDRVIINPGGRTNLSLGFEENKSYNYNYNYDRSDYRERDDRGAPYPAYVGGVIDGVAPRGVRGGHQRSGQFGPTRGGHHSKH
jgi:hypothetical protein